MVFCGVCAGDELALIMRRHGNKPEIPRIRLSIRIADTSCSPEPPF
jgi:hypothetical protein